MYAGNVLGKVVSKESPLKVLSIRPTSFDKAELVALNGSGPDEFFDPAEEITIAFDIANTC